MKALLLIGGQATRLWPLSKYLAKSLLPICDRELLYYQVAQLAYASVDEIILAAGAHVEQLRVFTDGFGGGLRFHFSVEPEPRGTAGAIACAAELIGDDSVIVLNADILTDLNLIDVIAKHRAAERPATLVGHAVQDPSRYGLLQTEGDAIRGFSEKPEGSLPPGPHYINAGVYILQPEVVHGIDAGRPVSIERETFPRLIAETGALTLYPHTGLWADIGTFESYFGANFALLNRRYALGEDRLWGQREDCAVFKDSIYVHKAARVDAGVDLYHRVILMAASEVGVGAKLNNVLVLPAAQIGPGAELESCIVGPGVVVEPEARIRNMLLVAGEPPAAFYPEAVSHSS